MRYRTLASSNDGKSTLLGHNHEVSMRDHTYEINSATKQRIKLVLGGMADRLQLAGFELKSNGKHLMASVGIKAAKRVSNKLHRIADRIEINAIKLQNKTR